MKCDELKVHKAYNRWLDEEMPTPNDDLICNEVYLKDEVDAAIAELKQKLEDAKASAYAESVDAGMENRRLKRALWLARSWMALIKYQMFCFSDHIGDSMNIHGFIQRFKGCSNMRNAKEWQKIWKNVELKCLKKAKEYR